jgi:L-ascorbate metabolism protein UlaG (beta-lactamase superfamily)
VPELARELGVPVYGIADLMGWWGASEQGLDTVGFNKGGTVMIGDVAVTMVAATHSSSLTTDDRGRSMRAPRRAT